jgi:uncharacterized protein (DUF58 family)
VDFIGACVPLASRNIFSVSLPVRARETFERFRRRNRHKIEEPSRNTTIRRRPGVDFSLTGLVYCAMMLFMGLAAINSQANLLFGVFGLMIGILIISASICRVVMMRLRVERVIPEYAAAGQQATIVYHFSNQKRFWPSFSVCLAELEGAEAFALQPHAYMLHAAPGRTASVPVEVTLKRRGLHRLSNYQVSSTFPFGFIKRAIIRREEDVILIYPAIGAVSPRLLSLCRSAERGGANMKPRRNGSDEFFGVKEYREGENPRWIYWKRSARTGQLVSKEMVQISPPRLVILVDTFIESPTLHEYAAVEKVLAMAASLANRAMDSGMAVGLYAWTGGWNFIAPQRGKRHSLDVLATLARMPLNRTANTKDLIEQSEGALEQNVTAVLLTPRTFEISLAEHSRGAMLVVAVDSPQAQAWFHFENSVDFTRCMPADQANGIEPAPAY